MPHAKARKINDRPERPVDGPRHKQQHAEIDKIIYGVDLLIAQAECAAMGTASRILYNAKEELVHWAVTMNFYESPQDRYINRHLYSSRLSIAEALLAHAAKESNAGAKMPNLFRIKSPKSASIERK